MDPWLTSVSGDDAAHYDAVSLSSFHPVNQGVLLSADAVTGEVIWKDKADAPHSVKLGSGAISIIRKTR